MYNNLFWGALLVLWGLSILFKAVFGFNIPFFRFLIAGALIYTGIVVLFNNHPSKAKTTVAFSEGHIKGNPSTSQYNVTFGKGIIDLRDSISENDLPKKIKINTAFGQSNVILDKNLPTKIILQAAFGKGTMPNGEVYFGTQKYKHNYQKPALIIKANVLFGDMSFDFK